ncbi:MAG: hypothetical protein AAF723_08675 [Pseudomonadota bacterium]
MKYLILLCGIGFLSACQSAEGEADQITENAPSKQSARSSSSSTPPVTIAPDGLSACSMMKTMDWQVTRTANENLSIFGKAVFPTPGWTVTHRWVMEGTDLMVALQTQRPGGIVTQVVTTQEIQLLLQDSQMISPENIILSCTE